MVVFPWIPNAGAQSNNHSGSLWYQPTAGRKFTTMCSSRAPCTCTSKGLWFIGIHDLFLRGFTMAVPSNEDTQALRAKLQDQSARLKVSSGSQSHWHHALEMSLQTELLLCCLRFESLVLICKLKCAAVLSCCKCWSLIWHSFCKTVGADRNKKCSDTCSRTCVLPQRFCPLFWQTKLAWRPGVWNQNVRNCPQDRYRSKFGRKPFRHWDWYKWTCFLQMICTHRNLLWRSLVV